jgi:hypothetical protein
MFLKKSNLLDYLNFKNLGILLIIFYILIRLPYLGFSNFNTDSFDWKSRIYNFGNGVFNFNLDNTVQKYHPGVTLLWVGAFSVKFFNLIYENLFLNSYSIASSDYIFALNFYQILFLILVQSFLVFLLFYFLSQIYDPVKSFLILMVLTIEPFFLGITTTLHLDGLLNLFLLNFLVTLYLSVKDSNRYYLYLSSIFFGFAMLTKTTALLMAPVVVLIYLAKFLWEKKFQISLLLKNLIIFSSTSFLVYYILFPSMWFDPLGTFNYLLKGIQVGTEDHYQLYFGQLVSDPGPFYYLIVAFIKATIYIFPALLVAAYTQLNTTYRKYSFEIFLFASSFLYLIEISIPAKKLDRYAFLFLILISLVVYSYVYDFSKKILLYFLGINLFFIFYLNFDYFSYYNPLAGGVKNAINLVEPKWVFGQKELTDFFANEKKLNGYDDYLESDNIQEIEVRNNKLIVAIPEKYMVQLYPYFQLISSKAIINTFSGEAAKANYFIFPVWQDNSLSGGFISNYNLVYYNSVTVRGVPIFNVYKINGR